MKDLSAPNAVVRLLRDLGETVKDKVECQPMLEAAVAKIGAHLSLDRCIIMLVSEADGGPKSVALEVVAEYVSGKNLLLGHRSYQMTEDAYFFTALKSGQVLRHCEFEHHSEYSGIAGIPNSLVLPALPAMCDTPLQKFVCDSESKSFVLFPLAVRNRVIGSLSMHFCESEEEFAEEIIELGVILTQLLAVAADRTLTIEDARMQQAEQTLHKLSKQVSWERWARQIICKLHSSLDRDILLQTAADSFGRALGASRCLIIRTEGVVSPVVTHEYVDSNISPLGLGRTSQFPLSAISPFRNKVAAVSDIATLEKSGELSASEYDYFAEHGVRGIAGAPIANNSFNYGVIIILENGSPRKWAPHELDMLELVAGQTAVALINSNSYFKLQDQLFNMNLLGNLTQQLTSTLELASRGNKPESDEKKLASTAPPLSLRELEVLKLIASGLANREIAQRLFLTESTVELHASRIRKKLKLKSRTALVKFACDNGLA